MLYSFVPYAADIIKGKVKPARSARLMMILLITVALLQQHSLGSGWLLALSIGDGVGAIAILALSIKYGVGGFRRLDIICYILLATDVAVWVGTGSALLALHLSILADLIVMTPVFIKTWREPWTETATFFALGVVGPILNILAVGRYRYEILIFPAYIAFVNLFEAVLILVRQRQLPRPKHAKLTHETLT